jgi:hypothetical protein
MEVKCGENGMVSAICYVLLTEYKNYANQRKSDDG